MLGRMPDEWLLYLRKSTGYAGISRQRASTTDHLARRGGTVALEFEDADRTAYRDPLAPLPRRPKFDALIAEMGRRPGVGVAAWHADRLGRDPEAAEILIRACMRGGHLISTTRGGDYDVATANGRSHLRDDINRATHEVDHNVERLVEAKAELAAAGRWLGGLRPFGWRPAPGDPGRLVLDDTEAGLIRAAAADVLAGVTVRAIARRWNDAGVTGSGGGRWTTTTVRTVLMRPRNAGLYEHRGQVAAIPGGPAWDPVVDEGTWRGICALLSDPGRRSNHGSTAASHLLTGIAVCGGCGVTVVAGNSADGTPRYRCSRHVRQLPPRPVPHASRRIADVDALITVLAVGRMKRPDAERLLRADHSADRTQLLASEQAMKARRREQGELYDAGVLDAAELTRQRRRIDAELADVGARLDALDEADVLAPMLADPARAWDAAPLGQRRAVVARLMHVTLMPGAKFSRPPGWKPGDGQFDPRMVDVRWARRLPSDG